jgi:ATP-dependent RNA helicase RhlE
MFSKKFPQALNTQLSEHGFDAPTALQSEVISKVAAGVDCYFGADEGAGKSTAIVLTCIWKLAEAFEDAPRALILVSDKDKALAMQEEFKRLARYTDLRAITAFEGGPIDIQRENIYIGADIVIGTPKRIQDIYFQNGLNVNKLKLFIIDDGEFLIRKGFQGVIHRFWQSLPKCQQLVFSADITERLQHLCDEFMKSPHLVETDA